MKLKLFNPFHEKNEQPLNLSEFYNLKIKHAHLSDPQGEDGNPFECDIFGIEGIEQDYKYHTIAAVQQLNNRLSAVEQGKPIPDDAQTVISDVSIDPQRIDALESQMKDLTKKLNSLINIVNKLTKKIPI